MPTYFFEIDPQTFEEHQMHFKNMHNMNMPNNGLTSIPNIAETSLLVKVNCNCILTEILPQGVTPNMIYTLEQVRELLQTPEWCRVGV